MTVILSHDPFARQSLAREQIDPQPGVTCSWCGGLNRYGKLFAYAIQSDGYGARPRRSNGLFCSVACMREYRA